MPDTTKPAETTDQAPSMPTGAPVRANHRVETGEGAVSCEDCKAFEVELITLRELNRKMQTALDLQDNELRELRARVAELVQVLDDRMIPWVSAMAAENSSHSKNTSLTNKQAVTEAVAFYAETERQHGGGK